MVGGIAVLVFGAALVVVANQHGKATARALLSWLCLVSVVVANNQFLPPRFEYGQTKFLYLILVITIAVLLMPIAVLSDAARARAFIHAMSVASAIFCVVSLFVTVESSDNTRANALELNPAIMSKMTLVLAIWAIAKMISDQRMGLLPLTLVIISIGSAVRTGTRGPLLALLVALLVAMIVVMGTRQLHKVALASLAMVGAVFAFLQFAPEGISSRFTAAAISISENSAEGDRVELWRTAFHIMDESPQGVGIGNFLEFHRFIAVPHNILLETGVEFGVVAAVLMGLILLLGILKGWNVTQSHSQDLVVVWMFLLLVFQYVNAALGGELTLQSFLLYVALSFFIMVSPPRTKEATQPPRST